MTDDQKKGKTDKRITEEQRLKYIGFEVFPGKPKDLFKNDAEKESLVSRVHARRDRGEIVRDDCKLLEERISLGERLVLTVASAVIVISLFLPWYSAYTETFEESTAQAGSELVADSLSISDSAVAGDSALMSDSTALAGVPSEAGDGSSEVTGGEGSVEESPTEETGEAVEGEETPALQAETSGPREEIITGHLAQRRAHRDYTNLSGIGAVFSLGSVGGYVFGSGAVLVFSGIVFLLYAVLCLALPGLTVYTAFVVKGSADEIALKLKKCLRYNWIPVILFFIVMVLSFLGAEYDPGVMGSFTSLGESYGPGVFLTTLSWGIYVTIAAFVLMAVKGIEI